MKLSSTFTITMIMADEGLELVRAPVPRGGSEETGYLVTKAAVVCVLHDGHQLDRVVAELRDSGQHVPCEFVIGVNFSFRRRYTHMALIYSDAFRSDWPRMLELVRRRRVPEMLTKCYSFLVLLLSGRLLHVGGPGGDAVLAVHKDLHFL